ncbi:hypothetical protein JOQ06_002841, partial [Pogonophryne albipinna]
EDRWPGLFQTACLVCIEDMSALQRPQRLQRRCQEEARRSFFTQSLYFHKAHTRSNNSITQTSEDAAARMSIPACEVREDERSLG